MKASLASSVVEVLKTFTHYGNYRVFRQKRDSIGKLEFCESFIIKSLAVNNSALFQKKKGCFLCKCSLPLMNTSSQGNND